MPPRYAEIRDDLRRPIVTGKFPPGESLPDRHTLMDQYDATVNAVRRALHDLAAEGLVVIGLHAVVAEPQFSDNRSCGDRVTRAPSQAAGVEVRTACARGKSFKACGTDCFRSSRERPPPH